MRDFRKLDIWTKSHALVLKVYSATKTFPPHERYGLTAQIRRASVSIPSNIAEGCGHDTDPEFARYLQLAAASTTEVQYQLILAHDLVYLADAEFSQLSKQAEEVKRMLSTFISKVRRRIDR